MTRLYLNGTAGEGKRNDAVRPNVVCYTAALNACAFPALSSPPPAHDGYDGEYGAYENDKGGGAEIDRDDERDECFDIANLLMEELRISPHVATTSDGAGSGGPNYLTYAAYLDVCAMSGGRRGGGGRGGEGRGRRAAVEAAETAARNASLRCAEGGHFGRAVYERLGRYFPNVLEDMLLLLQEEEEEEEERGRTGPGRGNGDNNCSSSSSSTSFPMVEDVNLPKRWTRNVRGERRTRSRRRTRTRRTERRRYIDDEDEDKNDFDGDGRYRDGFRS